MVELRPEFFGQKKTRLQQAMMKWTSSRSSFSGNVQVGDVRVGGIQVGDIQVVLVQNESRRHPMGPKS
jgi:hypothetical protein